MAGGGRLTRFSSRTGRLSHVFLKDRLKGASEYHRIAGYFRSSIFELIDEEIQDIPIVRIVCNSDLDERDIQASRIAREMALKERWSEATDEVEAFLRRPRYQRLYELLRRGNVEIRVVSRVDAPFLHGKAGVIRRGGIASAFMGSLNETREGWAGNYEMVWEDTSADGVAWVDAEFKHLWARSKPLPETIIEEIGRSARRVEVKLPDLAPDEVGPAALVEAPLYRRGEELKPWQRAFVGMFLQHREIYGKARFLLADEVGVGKTLSLAGAALVSSLLDDGPAIILCPATLCDQWQVELKDKLGIPSAVWLSARKVWRDHNGNLIRTRGPEDVARCPFQIGIVSTGLIFHDTDERRALLSRRYGTLILDEAHRARRARGLNGDDAPNNLLSFMLQAARSAKHVVLGTATPIQTDIDELWDLLDILGNGADHVLGRFPSSWRDPRIAVPLVTGARNVQDATEAWDLVRNPLPPRSEDSLFDAIRTDASVPDDRFFTDIPVADLDPLTRDQFDERLAFPKNGLSFFQQNNPLVRHIVLRKRKELEERGLMDRVAVDIWPNIANPMPMFEGLALMTSHEFDEAYRAADDFTTALRKRTKAAGFMKSLLMQRICSSYASGLATARKLLESRMEEDPDDEEALDIAGTVGTPLAEERTHLERIIYHLSRRPSDPKLDAARIFLQEKGWLDLGCIVFSQYFDTAEWIATSLAAAMPEETIALYAGAARSAILLGADRRSISREQIKRAVRDREIRLVVATDAACEGLNLQTLGTLINIDLPWNPSRLEQRIGRIKRFGQRRDRVDMLNLVYQGTIDERVYAALSRRMQDRYDIFGSLPDVIDDEWIEDIEHIEEHMSQFIEQKRRANAFDLRYAETVEIKGPRWDLFEKVLARHDVVERLSKPW